MKQLIFILLLIRTLNVFAADDKEREAQAILQRATATSAMEQPSFRVDGHVTLYAKAGPASGPFLVDTILSFKNRKEVHLPVYDEIFVTNVDRQYLRRTATFRPQPISDLFAALIPQITSTSNQRVERIKNSTIAGESVRCLHYKEKAIERVFCFDSLNGLLRSFGYGNLQVEYSKWIQQEGAWHPRHIAVKRNGKLTADAEITSYSPAGSEEAVLLPPEGSTARAWCAQPVPAKVVETAAPDIPPMVRNKLVVHSGTALIQVLVDDKGRVADAGVTQTMDGLETYFLQAVRKWKFKPAMCSDKPVPSEFTIEAGAPQ